MNGEHVANTGAQRILLRSCLRAEIGMTDVIALAANVMRDRARRLVPLTRRRTAPVFELLIVNDELADLAACLSDGGRRTHIRRDSLWTSRSRATCAIGRPDSSAVLTARSRNSGGYFLPRAI